MLIFTLMTSTGGNTGNYYYGARYYDPKVSVWLSVDPWATKYPHVTPYNFVENNPIRLVDPTGLGPECEDCPEGSIEPVTVTAEKLPPKVPYELPAAENGPQPPSNTGGASAEVGPGADNSDDESQSAGNSSGDGFSRGDYDRGIGASGLSLGSKGALINYAAKTGEVSNAVKTYSKINHFAGKSLGYASGIITIGDALYNSEVNASHLLDLTVTGLTLATGPVGWVIGGSYFLINEATSAYSGQSIGQHLDNAAGGSLYDWEW